MHEHMRSAIAAVKSGVSVLRAAILNNVSEPTLRRRLINPCPNPHGGKTIFTRFEEESFETLLKGFEMMKLPLTKVDFLTMVKAEAHRKRKRS